MKAIHIKALPKKCNVFNEDFTAMGIIIGVHDEKKGESAGNRIMLMHYNHSHEELRFPLTIVNEATGERLQITK